MSQCLPRIFYAGSPKDPLKPTKTKICLSNITEPDLQTCYVQSAYSYSLSLSLVPVQPVLCQKDKPIREVKFSLAVY